MASRNKPVAEPADLLIEAALARHDPSLHANKVPAGYGIQGVSILKDGDGNTMMTWTRTTKDRDHVPVIIEAFRQAIAAKPIALAKRVVKPRRASLDQDLLSVYLAGDPHVGMLSWDHETGENFDVKIARQHLLGAMDQLISASPASETAIIANLGDGVHADGLLGNTTAGTRVDTDTRWPKMVQVFMETFNHGIRRALEKHQHVVMANMRGNHDDQTSIMVAMCMAEHWRNEPRVTIEPNLNMFYWHEFGANLLGFTHGHTVKANSLPGVMATDQAQAWGRTKFRYMYCGHVHHELKKEHGGVVIEYFRTLAPKDQWHHSHGYRAGRSMSCDVLHRKFGRILRHEVGIDQVQPRGA